MALSVLPQTPTAHPFSSLSLLTGADHLHLQLRRLTLHPHHRLPCPPIRMGGGPRTFPGGVSKWQWKRMQAKKAKQLLKARLLRERQIYEMRKRTELRAAVSELERPWEEVAQRAPNLFSVCADEQLKTLADRFQRPGGFDMWSERDGPQVFRSVANIPSDRFFPKGAVHSVKPYGAVNSVGEDLSFDDWIARGGGNTRRRRRTRRSLFGGGAVVDVEANDSSDDCNEEDDRESHRTDSPRPGVHGSTERSGGVGGRGRGGRGGRRMNAGRGSLRPSADLYAEDDGYRMRGYKEKFVEGSHVGSDYSGNVEVYRGRGRRGGGTGSRRTDIERVSLRPTSELCAEDEGYSMGDSTGGRLGGRDGIDRRERFEQGGRFGSDMGDITHGEGQRSKIVGRNSGVRGYSRANAGKNSGGRGNGRMNVGRVSLRPGADLYADDGGFNGMRESGGVRSSARGSTTRRQISEESSRFESYASAIGNGQGQHGKNVERDLDGRGNHQMKAGRVSLPPTSDFYADDGRNMLRDSKWGGGNGSSRTRTSG